MALLNMNPLLQSNDDCYMQQYFAHFPLRLNTKAKRDKIIQVRLTKKQKSYPPIVIEEPIKIKSFDCGNTHSSLLKVSTTRTTPMSIGPYRHNLINVSCRSMSKAHQYANIVNVKGGQVDGSQIFHNIALKSYISNVMGHKRAVSMMSHHINPISESHSRPKCLKQKMKPIDQTSEITQFVKLESFPKDVSFDNTTQKKNNSNEWMNDTFGSFDRNVHNDSSDFTPSKKFKIRLAPLRIKQIGSEMHAGVSTVLNVSLIKKSKAISLKESYRFNLNGIPSFQWYSRAQCVNK